MNNKEFNDRIDEIMEAILEGLRVNKGALFSSPTSIDFFERKLLFLYKMKELKYPEGNSIYIEDGDVKIYKESKELMDNEYFNTKLSNTPLPGYLVNCLHRHDIRTIKELVYVKINDLRSFDRFGPVGSKAIDFLLERFSFDIDWKCKGDLRIIDFYKPD